MRERGQEGRRDTGKGREKVKERDRERKRDAEKGEMILK
jgi:hypothetical protein